MFRKIRKLFGGRRHGSEINPEDIFIDSANLPNLNRDRFEGRMEKPIGEGSFLYFKAFILLLALLLGGKLMSLQVLHGEEYAKVSEENRLTRSIIFADRGVIFDRKGAPLAWNAVKNEGSDFASREYAAGEGVSTVLGYVKYPSKDKSGIYYDELYHGHAGAEKQYDALLAGANGSKLTETDALGNLTSESVVVSPESGEDLHLSIDASLTQELYRRIADTARTRGFTGGAGVIMDVRSGEVLALVSYPEYSSAVMTSGEDEAEIERLLSDKRTPLLNRAVSGLYTPGSIVKPIVALGALNEAVISPEKTIFSSGQLVLPNPYNPDNPSIFRDWKAHGAVDMREALAVSSDVYFYQIGGGFEKQRGLGITKLDEYFTLFGFAEETGIDLPAEIVGYIATPEWKARVFPDDPDWRIGNTYHTAIGQYGTQITPLTVARSIAAIANGGKLLTPSIVKDGKPEDERVARIIDLSEEYYEIVREGMRRAVTHGTASGLSNPNVAVAGKTGTAELGARKEFVNSWVVGFFPYEEPRYAFAVIMEKGPATNLVGATAVFRPVLDWMALNTPEYFE